MLIMIIVMIQVPSFGQVKATVEEIFDNPGKYINELVVINGFVMQYTDTTHTTSYYLLQSSFGGVITVNTSMRPPVIHKKYQVKGIVVMDQIQGRPVVIEKSRIIYIPWVIYVLGAAVLILIILLIMYLIRGFGGAKGRVPTADLPHSDSDAVPLSSYDYKTVKIYTNAPPTMRLIPGELEIISGQDKGKSFRMAGYSTEEGDIVTIGRESRIEGDKKYAHIQISQDYRTVSHMQAEIIYRNGELSIRNLSATNPTEVDDKILTGNKTVVLKPGTVIRMGELEFRYKI